jgi:hypothetical protein
MRGHLALHEVRQPFHKPFEGWLKALDLTFSNLEFFKRFGQDSTQLPL